MTSIKRVLCYYAHDRLWPIDRLRAHFLRAGASWEELRLWTSWGQIWDAVSKVRRADLVILWNGQDVGCQWLRRACQVEGKPCVVAEWGFFPQKETFHLDRCGIVGDSSLCGPLDWVDAEAISRYRVFREKYLAGRGLGWRGDAAGGPVLVPLQIEHDSAVIFHSPIRRMSDLVRHVADAHPGREVWVVRHPMNRGQRVGDGPWKIKDGPTIDAAQDAGKVVGLTSTSLLEAAMLGVPTVALGRCALAAHARDPERLLAACVSRQIPRGEIDLTPLVDNVLEGQP